MNDSLRNWLQENESLLDALQLEMQDGKTDELRLQKRLREKDGRTPEQAAALLELLRLRKHAEEKFPQAGRMFFLQTGLEQATDAHIAEYKARKFPEGAPLADLCCGVGGDLCAFARRGPVLGVDRDADTAWCARQNLRALVPGACAEVQCTDVQEFLQSYPPEKFPCLHIDPDRRADGVRTTRMEFFEPKPEVVQAALTGRRVAAVKLAPGSEVPDLWREMARERKMSMELEWIGRARECRQLLVWFREENLENSGGISVHRATIINSQSSEIRTTLRGTPNLPVPAAPEVQEFVYDVDSTFLAAHMEGALAEKYGLSNIMERGGYLTSSHWVEDEPALQGFQVLERLPLDRKKIVAAVKKWGWGILDIKKKGALPIPEEAARWFKLPSNRERGTLLLMRDEKSTLAILAKSVKK